VTAVNGVTKRGERVMTVAGVIVGLVVGVFIFQKVIGNRMVEAGRFTMAVFIGGLAGMGVYVLVKDGIGALLRRAAGPSKPATTETAPADVAEPDVEAQPEPAAEAPKTSKPRRPPLRATVPPEPDDDEDEPAPRPKRERPLRPKN
jgi:hypothetical protein